jgi:hypothetical protein
MTKEEKNKYWMECIQNCRVSGMSDYEWCHRNGIPTSSFYYNVKRLRMNACAIPAAVSKTVEKQEVVPVHYNELPENKTVLLENDISAAAVKVEYNGVVVSIGNHADNPVIMATLKALLQLC